MIESMLGIPAQVGSPGEHGTEPLTSGKPEESGVAATFLALLIGQVGDGELLATTIAATPTPPGVSTSEAPAEETGSGESQSIGNTVSSPPGRPTELPNGMSSQSPSVVSTGASGGQPNVPVATPSVASANPPGGAVVIAPEPGETAVPPAATLAAERASPPIPESLNENARAPVIILPDTGAHPGPVTVNRGHSVMIPQDPEPVGQTSLGLISRGPPDESAILAEQAVVARPLVRPVRNVPVSPLPNVQQNTGGQPSQDTAPAAGGFAPSGQAKPEAAGFPRIPGAQASFSIETSPASTGRASAVVVQQPSAASTAVKGLQTAATPEEASLQPSSDQTPSPSPIAMLNSEKVQMKAAESVSGRPGEPLMAATSGRPAGPLVVPPASPESETARSAQSEGRNPKAGGPGRSPSTEPVSAPVLAEETESASAARVEVTRTPTLRGPFDRLVEAQIVRGAKLMVKGGQTEMTIRLHPPHLGNVRLTLVSADSQIGITVHAENEAVRQMIQARAGELHQTLQDRGVDVSYINVASDSNSSLQERHPENVHLNSPQSFRVSEDELTADGSEPTVPEAPLGVNRVPVGLDIMV